METVFFSKTSVEVRRLHCVTPRKPVIIIVSTIKNLNLSSVSDISLLFSITFLHLAGSLPYICQPIGSLSSGFLVQWLGRKKSMMIINIPYCVGCIMISMAPSITVLFLANVLLGTTIGLTEAPINSYFGEICQPELRSILAGSAGNKGSSPCPTYSCLSPKCKVKLH